MKGKPSPRRRKPYPRALKELPERGLLTILYAVSDERVFNHVREWEAGEVDDYLRKTRRALRGTVRTSEELWQEVQAFRAERAKKARRIAANRQAREASIRSSGHSWLPAGFAEASLPSGQAVWLAWGEGVVPALYRSGGVANAAFFWVEDGEGFSLPLGDPALKGWKRRDLQVPSVVE